MIRVTPLLHTWQTETGRFRPDRVATPEERTVFADFFQQTATSIYLRAPHDKLDIRMQARVAVDSPSPTADLSPQLNKLQRNWPASIRSMRSTAPSGGCQPAHRRGCGNRGLCPRYGQTGMTVREIAFALCKRIYADFKYDSEATTVDTTPIQAFKLKRGVCQDFSHIMISALRSLGIPAGYVSGFLRTIPPPARSGWKARMPCTPGCVCGAVRRTVTSSSTDQ